MPSSVREVLGGGVLTATIIECQSLLPESVTCFAQDMQPHTACVFAFALWLTAAYAEAATRNLSIYYDMDWKVVPMSADSIVETNLKDNRLSFGPLPCSCEDSRCGCCVNMNINFISFSRKGCMNLSYVPNNFAIQMDVLMDDKPIYTNSISGKNPPPVCIPAPYIPIMEFCIKVFDIYTEGSNIHMCINFETRIIREPIFVLQFDCMQMGSDGFSHFKPIESSVGVEESQ